MEKQRHTIVALRMLCRTVLCFALFVICSTAAMAQGRAISGSVVSETDGQPILGATVIVEGTTLGTATDIDGKFTIANAPASGNLVISYIGYSNLVEPIASGKKYDVSLVEDTQKIDEVVVVGYGTMRKKEVTGAVARVDAEELTKISTSDVGSALQGQIAGVSVSASSGEPGSTANIQIRGLSSISGSSDPLYVVDGVPYSGDPGLSPSEIESIDVLKDAASAAIYGTRGASGVILITTKKGQKGQMKLKFDGYYGIQNITNDLEMNNLSDYFYAGLSNNATSQVGSRTFDQYYTTWQGYTSAQWNDSNLYDTIINDNAAIQNYSLSASGGADGITYNVMGNYFNQEGSIIKSTFERYNLRADLNLKRKNLTLNTNVNIKSQEKVAPGGSLLLLSYNSRPTAKDVDINADTTGDAGDSNSATALSNVLSQILETVTTAVNSYNANIYVAYDLPYNFQISSRLGLGYSEQRYTDIKPLIVVYDSEGELKESSYTRSKVVERSITGESTTWEAMLNWGQTYGKHDVRFTGVFSTEQYTSDRFDATIYDLTSTEIENLNTGTADVSVYSLDSENTLVGMLGRIQYNYDSRFMLSGSIRRDASSRFASTNRWGYFPSISGGWNVSEEKFWEPISNTISNLKVRASYGTTGNQSFDNYAFQTTITQDYNYVYGTGTNQTPTTGATQTEFSNASIGWETTKQLNIGFDASFFNNTLTLTADRYKSSKSDMLFPLSVPASSGAGGTSVTINVGDMTNQGYELALGYRNNIKKKFYYTVNATFATNDNCVTDMGGSSDGYYFEYGYPTNSSSYKVTMVKEGYEAGAFFCYPTDGVINTEEKLAYYQSIDSDYRMGDLAYVDTDGSGEIDDNDRVYCGSGIPEYEIGFNYKFNYKNFDLYMNWYSNIGNEIINGTNIYNTSSNKSSDSVYKWSEQYPESALPSGRSSSQNYYAYTDIWVEDGSFLRLKNVALGYSLPKKVLNKLNISKLRVYVAADNWLTFTGYSGYDPEVGSNGLSKRGLDWTTYPISRQVRGGVQLEF